MLGQEFQISFDIATMLEQDMATNEKFAPPNGRLLLAWEGATSAGCACMQTLSPGIAELKRMYVRPAYRRQGVGRALVQTLVADLAQAGYTRLRLDSANFMQEAHALYRSLGFKQRDAYAESDIPAQFRQHWVFMERSL